MAHAGSLESFQHSHNFLGEGHGRNERRTWIVVALTAGMMAVEIVAGLAFHSMALLADGIHMATHAGALTIAGLAYWFARRHVRNERFTFGTGKVGDLAGFSSAMILAMVAVLVIVDAISHLMHPVAIAYTEAIMVASVGLVVNLTSAWLLRDDHGHGHAHAHDDHDHDDEHEEHDAHEEHEAREEHVARDHDHGGAHEHHHHDHNLRSAYVHVLADALTSVFAIAALFAARYFGWAWIDPVVGMVGALVVANWAYGLMRDTGLVLLDGSAGGEVRSGIRKILETDTDRISDLHVWRVGPGRHAAIISLVTHTPHDPMHYKARLAALPTLAHVTVEVTPCSE